MTFYCVSWLKLEEYRHGDGKKNHHLQWRHQWKCQTGDNMIQELLSLRASTRIFGQGNRLGCLQPSYKLAMWPRHIPPPVSSNQAQPRYINQCLLCAACVKGQLLTKSRPNSINIVQSSCVKMAIVCMSWVSHHLTKITAFFVWAPQSHYCSDPAMMTMPLTVSGGWVLSQLTAKSRVQECLLTGHSCRELITEPVYCPL